MSLIRIRDPDALQPLHVVLICIVTGTLLGGFLFLSAAESQTLVDGAVEWRVDSPLRAIVQLLCLNYHFPTIHAGAIKVYLLGLGSGLAVLALSIAFAVRSRDDEDDPATSDIDVATQCLAADDGTDRGSVVFALVVRQQPLVGSTSVGRRRERLAGHLLPLVPFPRTRTKSHRRADLYAHHRRHIRRDGMRIHLVLLWP